MRFSGWIRCLICSAFLFSFHPSEPASGNQTTDQHRLPGSNETELTQCSCIDEKDRKYNLASLAKKGGGPRFTVQAKDNYFYSYNPCVSFTLGSFGDCSDGNVAVCRWTNTSYENIGYQGRARCALQWDGTPKLVYPAKRPWLSVVNLQCDPERKSIQSAEFSVMKDDKARPVRFLLKHYCACPNACPDETPTRPFEKSWKTVGVPILVAVGCLLLLCTACIVDCRLLMSRRNPPQEVAPLIGEEGQDRGSDMRYNTTGALSQTEATSNNDEDFVTASSTMTSVQDDPISDPTIVLKSVNEISKIHKQGPVRESDCASPLINEAKV